MLSFLLVLAVTRPATAQLSGQSFVVTPDTSAVTVGDSVMVRFRIRLHERDKPLDSIPQVVGELTPGVRVLAVEKLTARPGRVYEGSARLAFYRPGRRPVPIFGLPIMRVVEGVSRATLPSDSAFVEVAAVLPPAGNPPLKDIRELEPRPTSVWPPLALALALLAGAGLYSRFRRRRPTAAVPAEPPLPAEALPLTPYEIALERLAQVERERWPEQGQVALHYEAVAQVVRQYLESAHDVRALERTTSELLWSLPPHLSRDGLRDRCLEVLAQADLVKFADVRPSGRQAGEFLARARRLLTTWHATAAAEENAVAIR